MYDKKFLFLKIICKILDFLYQRLWYQKKKKVKMEIKNV